MDIKKFQKPQSIMRPTPFWAINDRIIPEETARQMDDMLSVGLGGGFFHSRAGLITEYMGEEWFAAMKSALDVAKKKDGYLWLYDEDLWPSGNAGGQVAAIKDEFRATYIRAVLLSEGEVLPSLKEEVVIYGYRIIKRSALKLEEFEPMPSEDIEKVSGERLVIVKGYLPKTAWWSGESYANLLHPGAIQEFIRLTHERYYKNLGEEFGKRIPGIFTDEPNVNRGLSAIPWYERIPEKYIEWTGRNFWGDLPYIYFDGNECRYIRLLIHRTLLRQFIEAYSKPLYEWCARHNIAYTGHYNAEDTFSRQIINHCGGVMAHYQYQHIPGIDHLFRMIDSPNPILFTAKQASSVARQLGRQNVLSEIFGVTRHTNTFQDFKWLGDYDLVLGVTFFCPHLSWYSGKGRRKRDYPPVWNYQQTYWKELPVLNDYFTRIAVALTSGRPDVKILLLHSIESAIAGRRLGITSQRGGDDIPADDIKESEVLDSAMRKALDAILNTGYDCDLGDENLIGEFGKVKGKRFIIGKMTYKIVVVPPSYTWREKTVSLLERFIENNGIVIILGRPPEEIDGIYNKGRWQKLLSGRNVYCLPNSVESIQNIITSLHPSTYTLCSSEGRCYTKTYIQHRTDGKEEIFFIVNSDREDERDYILIIENAGNRKLLKWDVVSGDVCLADTKKEKGGITYQFTLPPAGSILLTLSSITGNIRKEKKMPDINSADILRLPSVFEFERKDANVLVLDRIGVSYDGRNFEKEELEWRVRKNVAEHFGTSDALQWQPWVAIKKGLFDGRGGDIVLRYKFCSDIKSPECYLVIEDMQKGRVSVNGIEVPVVNNNLAWHWDRSFKKLEITEYVKKGENIVDFRVKYDFLTEVEPAYIVGDFGVKIVSPYRGEIVQEARTIKTGSLVEQGYPFYSGRMVYKTEFDLNACKKKVYLRLVNPSGILFNLRINSRDAGRILWRPYITEITSFVKSGKNRIELELVTSLQNSWGPLHEKDGDDHMWVGPNAFEYEILLREEFSLFNYGLGGIEVIKKWTSR